MSWVKTDFEKYVESVLVKRYGEEKAEVLFSGYVTARTKVIKEIKQIQGVEPDLSDHGPDHIADVMNRVLAVISDDDSQHGLDAADLYILLMSILFHDVGNLFGREKHNERIGEVFDHCRGTESAVRREKALVVKAARAHTGRSATGDKDTLTELDDKEHFDGGVIKLQSIAAILRLSDELAEGPQRTTEYFRNAVGYADGSKIFHEYASCTHVTADRGNRRICLTYEIVLNDYREGDGALNRTRLLELLSFVRHRICKLDQERRYTRFYCDALGAFKKTEVRLNFWSNGSPVPFDFSFDLDDLVVPGSNAATDEDLVLQKFGTSESVADRLSDTLSTMESDNED